MFPGLTTRISGTSLGLTTTITPQGDLVRVVNTTSTTVLATIIPPFGGQDGVLFLYNGSGGNITTVTTGNIQTARTIPDQMLVLCAYSKALNKFLIGAIS